LNRTRKKEKKKNHNMSTGGAPTDAAAIVGPTRTASGHPAEHCDGHLPHDCGVTPLDTVAAAAAETLRRSQLTPAQIEEERLLHGETTADIDMTWNDESDFVYVAMSSDIIHHGHVNIIQHAASLGRVVIGLMTDESISSYKRQPIIPYKYRKIVISNMKGVYAVIPQQSVDYCPNVRLLKAKWVVHGTDWRTGPQVS
jgi:cytidyltransferase-like protein